jgi:predicted dehydrogenase
VSERPLRVAVVGVGDFGRNHVRVWRELGAEIVGVVDTNPERARAVAAAFGTEVLPDLEAVAARAEAASVAVPTVDHAAVGCRLMELGLDVLVEKPIAVSLAEADALISTAARRKRILMVGHLERFNPGVVAAQKILVRPLFFEGHRLGVFTPRSLDIDVVFDLMIHDLDIVLALTASEVTEVKAVGIPILTDKIDIAHARLAFASGAVANLTASRVSVERIRRLRFFQEHEYISMDYQKREAMRIRVAQGLPNPQFAIEKLPVEPEEPLRAELRAFAHSVRTRQAPVVDGAAGRRALALAQMVMDGISVHARRVQLGTMVPQAP